MGNIKFVAPQKEDEKKSDLRIQRGQAMQRLQMNPDFKIYLEELSSRRNEAAQEFLIFGNSKNGGSMLRAKQDTYDFAIKTLGVLNFLPGNEAVKFKLFLFFLKEKSKSYKDQALKMIGQDVAEYLRSRLHTLDEIIGITRSMIIEMKIAINEEHD